MVVPHDTAASPGDEEKARKEERFKMAKKSLEKGLSIELVSELTGLSKEDIENL
jgi:predicted transposase YdaD